MLYFEFHPIRNTKNAMHKNNVKSHFDKIYKDKKIINLASLSNLSTSSNNNACNQEEIESCKELSVQEKVIALICQTNRYIRFFINKHF